jgi:hypothetical protein
MIYTKKITNSEFKVLLTLVLNKSRVENFAEPNILNNPLMYHRK